MNKFIASNVNQLRRLKAKNIEGATKANAKRIDEIIKLYERPPKPLTFWNSHTRTLRLDTIMKLSGTIGVTQKTMTFDTHVCMILLQTLNPQER